MPTLFISYKRDDRVAVTKISDRLRKEFYFDIWIDAVSISGGEDWRAEIRKGIDKSDVVLLMLTPDACASPQVKEEVDYAKTVERKILPLQIKKVSSADQNKLGVEHLNYIDFAGSHDDRFAWEKLIDDLPPVLARDKRLLDPKFRKLHRDYLRSLFARLGKVNLTYLLDAAPREQVSLFDVYVPLKLGVSFNIQVTNGEYEDWWLRDQTLEVAQNVREVGQMMDMERPKSLLGFAPQGSPLSAWEERLREGWKKHKAKHDEVEAKKPEKARTALKDGVYRWWRIESEMAAALMPHIVITGDPGSGKSTLLRHLALCMAGDMLSEEGEVRADLNALGFWPLPAYTPLYIELRALVGTAFPALHDEVNLKKFLDYVLNKQLEDYGLAHYLDDLRDQLSDGDVMIFLDGLDEVPDADKPERRKQIRALVDLLREQYPKCRIVVTSRPYVYAGDWQLEGFGQVKLAPLDADRLEELALRLFQVVLGQEGAQQEAPQFKEQMKPVRGELRRSPLFFTLMAAIWLYNHELPLGERLPLGEAAIYRECVHMLIRRWTRKDLESGQSLADVIGLDAAQLRTLLETLAYQLQRQHGSENYALFESGMITTIVRRDLKVRGVDYDNLIEALAQRAGITYERAPEEFQFAHRTFQEHLAASYLARPEHFPTLTVECVGEAPLLWRNVMDLLPDEAQRQHNDLWLLVKAFLPDATVLPSESSDPQWYRLFYAARLMRDYDLPQDSDLREVYRPRLQKLLAALLEKEALSPIDRAEMGRFLGDLGDPRKGVGVIVRDGVTLPDIDWVPIPDDGEWTYQGTRHPGLPAFKISRYPITHVQFQAFLDAPDGFKNDDWWAGMPDEEEDFGRVYKVREMREARWPIGNHPRENVSWYQVVAFCRWLNAGLGYEVRLPTEQEWEKAARGTDGREYPYEGEFNAAKGNTEETGIGQTSAVGIFPSGASPYGVLDMSGNVWEWCLHKFDNPTMTDLDASGDTRVLRGGSWLFNQYHARAVYRYDDLPDSRSSNDGFRVVCGFVPS